MGIHFDELDKQWVSGLMRGHAFQFLLKLLQSLESCMLHAENTKSPKICGEHWGFVCVLSTYWIRCSGLFQNKIKYRNNRHAVIRVKG